MKQIKNYINESLIKSYDTNKLCNKIEKKYPNIYITFESSKSSESATLFKVVFNDEEDFNKFKTDIYIQRQLDFFGYYITEYIDKSLSVYVEPNFGTKCTDFVYKNCKGLIFHVTKKSLYEDKIRYQGLKPKIGNIKRYRYFPERIFLICGETVDEIIDNINLIIKQKRYSEDNYVILMIDLKANKYNIDFYYDSSEDNWHNCIYCNAYFPCNYITKIRKLSDIEANINKNLNVAPAPWSQT